MSRHRVRSVVPIAFIVLFGLLGALFGQRVDPRSADAVREGLRKFTSVYDLVEQNYAEPVDPTHVIYDGAIPAMLRVLDPHSTFFDPSAYAALREEQSGKYYGVGMTIGPRGGRVVVIAPTPGTPAYRAGVRPGDVILAVNGKSTENMNTAQVADLVKGPEGSKVQITILRHGSSQLLELTLIRVAIPHASVDVHFLIRPGVGYVHIAMFNETTAHELQKTLQQFGYLKGLVLDLRQNPGGLLDQAVAVADKFLPRGAVIVSQRGRASEEHVYRAAQGNDGRDYPLVVLVDRGTASAAEIVTGAIQDHDRGLVVGEDTFGKGLVQTVYPLSNDTGLALTTAQYYTPSGRLIQRNYTGVSLYDYFYHLQSISPRAQREVRSTDSGRTVYGGDGITPDVKFTDPKPDRLENALLARYTFFDFAQQYLGHHVVNERFQADAAVLREFRQYLDAHQIPYTAAELNGDRAWIKTNLETEILTDQFGVEAGLQARAESDPEVREAVNLLPQAEALQQHAERVIAERAGKNALPVNH